MAKTRKVRDKKDTIENWQELVLFLRNTAGEYGISDEEIARRTGFNRSNINRIFNLRYTPGLSAFVEIANALGISVRLEDNSPGFSKPGEKRSTIDDQRKTTSEKINKSKPLRLLGRSSHI
jgi:transcriptional regulator with XRE-family HTH domain